MLGPWNAEAQPGDTAAVMFYGNIAGAGWVATRAGTIVGLSASNEEGLSAGNVSLVVTVNGATTAVTVTMTSATEAPFVDGDSVAFAAGAVITVQYTASGDLAPADGLDITANVTVVLA